MTVGEGTEAHNIRLSYEAADQPLGQFPAGVTITLGNPIPLLTSGEKAQLSRQFAKSLDEALKYADTDLSKVAIMKATVNKNALQSFYFSKNIDPFIFKNGIYTVQPGKQSQILTESIQSIEHAF